jgi:hypothetical protein
LVGAPSLFVLAQAWPIAESWSRLFRSLKGVRRIFSRFDKPEAMFIAFINFAVIVEGLR